MAQARALGSVFDRPRSLPSVALGSTRLRPLNPVPPENPYVEPGFDATALLNPDSISTQRMLAEVARNNQIKDKVLKYKQLLRKAGITKQKSIDSLTRQFEKELRKGDLLEQAIRETTRRLHNFAIVRPGLPEYLVLNELTPRDQGRANVMVDISRQGLYDRQNDPRYNAWYFSQN